ncbi:glycosyltransferase family protein [Enterobacter ludwigii]|uniref:hypothetical protein n=1 Tax=Enterobacter ludwigii TaxID=299767 RepID=UPI0039755441
MAKKNKRFPIVLVEGETEKALIDDFKRKHKDPIKRIIKLNLWLGDVNKVLISLTEQNDIIVVFDTDAKDGFDTFHKNIKAILARKHNVFLLQQTNNFENELTYACKCTENTLFSLFCKKIKSCDNFKASFLKSKTRLEMLESLGFKKDLLWQRGLISELLKLNYQASSYNNILDS